MLTLYPYPLPPAQTPLVTPATGTLSTDGRQLLLALLNRTGGSSGAPSVGVGLVVIAGVPFNIVNDWSEFDAVGAGGVAIIPELTVGSEIIVFNGGVVSLAVTPQPDTQIDALGLGAAYSLATLTMQVFRCFAPQQIRSMQLG